MSPRRTPPASARRAKQLALEERLAAVRAARADPTTPAAAAALRAALGDASNAVVAMAAELIADAELAELAPDLPAAFRRFLDRPVESDPGCLAKRSVVRALLATGAHDAGVYRIGVAHAQPEPAWGKPVDTAAELRGQSALGLARARHPDAAVAVATLLADAEPAARAGAAHAAAEIDMAAAIPLLRFKLLAGDDEPAVMAACFASLLAIAPEPMLPVAAAYLDVAEPAFAEAVAIALGESHRAGAVPILQAWSTRVGRPSRPIAYVALTLLRDDRATDFLVGVVAGGLKAEAEDALSALAPFRHEARLRERVLDAARGRGDAALARLAAERLGDGSGHAS